MATKIGLPLPFLGLIVPLYTLPKPPSPTFCDLLKPFVESLSSWNGKAIKFCSFSLYNSGMLFGEGNELEDFVPRSKAEVRESLLFLNSGADFDSVCLLLDLKGKKHFIS